MKHLTLNRKRILLILGVFCCLLVLLTAVNSVRGHSVDNNTEEGDFGSIYQAVSAGVINGVNHAFFKSDGFLTKAECIKLAAYVRQYREDGAVSEKGVELYLKYGAENGLDDLSREDLNDPVTRGEAADLFAKALGEDDLVINHGTRHYRDVTDESAPHYDGIYTLYRYGVMIGDDKGCFHPDSHINRAEAAVVVCRAADDQSRVKGEIPLERDVPLPVLMYHDFDTESRDYTTSEATFRSHLEMFRREGYTTITFEELLRYRKGEDNLPMKPILLISDDGYLGVLEYALPLLEEYDMNMSVAMIGNLIGSRGEGQLSYFTLDEERAADKEGRIELISHSNGLHEITGEMHGAKNLTLSADEYLKRIASDCGVMKEYAGDEHPMMTKVFVYPYGACSAESEAALAANGYEATVTTQKGIAKVSPGGSLGLLPRITAEWYLTGEALLKQLK